jgi:hypothetical protein
MVSTDLLEHNDRFYHRQVDRVVQGLRDLADAVERAGHDVRPRTVSASDDKPVYSDAARRALDEFRQNGIPFDILLSAAIDADLFQRMEG